MKKRLVVYVGYDGNSAKILKRVDRIKKLFDDVRVIYVPENDPNVLSNLAIPSLIVEEVNDSMVV